MKGLYEPAARFITTSKASTIKTMLVNTYPAVRIGIDLSNSEEGIILAVIPLK
jgi:hypothetical protein